MPNELALDIWNKDDTKSVLDIWNKPVTAFDSIYDFTLDQEGGFTVDHAGKTNKGVTQSTYDAYRKKKNLPPSKVEEISPEETRDLYQNEFYLSPKLDKFSPKVAGVLFDYGVNSSPKKAVMSLQKIVGTDVDGVVGPKTIKATNDYMKQYGEKNLVDNIINDRKEFYKTLIQKNPALYQQYENGWKNRIINLRQRYSFVDPNNPDEWENIPPEMRNPQWGGTMLAELNPFKIEEAQAAEPQFETKLTPQEETEFQKWKIKYAPNDSGLDYDLRGAFKAGLKPNEGRHWPDTYKKPNHPTFSVESVYAKDRPDLAGHWEGDKFIKSEVNKPEESKVMQTIANLPGVSYLLDFAEKIMPLKEWEKIRDEQINFVTKIPGLFIGATQAPGIESPETAMKKEKILTESIATTGEGVLKTIARIPEGARGVLGGILDKKPAEGLFQAGLQGFFKPGEVESLVSRVPFQEQEQGAWYKLIPRATAEAIETMLIYNVAYGNPIGRIRNAYREFKEAGAAAEFNKITTQMAQEIVNAPEKYKVNFPKEWNEADKLGMTKAYIQNRLGAIPKVGDALMERQGFMNKLFSTLKSEVGEARLPKISVFKQPLTQHGFIVNLIDQGKKIPKDLLPVLGQMISEQHQQIGMSIFEPDTGDINEMTDLAAKGELQLNKSPDVFSEEAHKEFYPPEEYAKVKDYMELQQGGGIAPQDKSGKELVIGDTVKVGDRLGIVQDIFDDGTAQLKTIVGIKEVPMWELNKVKMESLNQKEKGLLESIKSGELFKPTEEAVTPEIIAKPIPKEFEGLFDQAQRMGLPQFLVRLRSEPEIYEKFEKETGYSIREFWQKAQQEKIKPAEKGLIKPETQEQPVLPSKEKQGKAITPKVEQGLTLAIKLKNGTVISDKTAELHSDIITNKSINPDEVKDVGILDKEGNYQATKLTDEKGGAPLETLPEVPPGVVEKAKGLVKPEVTVKEPWQMTKEEFENIPIIKYVNERLKDKVNPLKVSERNQLAEQLVDVGLMNIEDFNAMTGQFGFGGKVAGLQNLTTGKPIPSKPIDLTTDMGARINYIGQWHTFHNVPRFAHRDAIVKALTEGKKVPQSVLDEYKDWSWPDKEGNIGTLKEAVESYGGKLPEVPKETMEKVKGLLPKITKEDLTPEILGKLFVSERQLATKRVLEGKSIKQTAKELGETPEDVIKGEQYLVEKIPELKTQLAEARVTEDAKLAEEFEQEMAAETDETKKALKGYLAGKLKPELAIQGEYADLKHLNWLFAKEGGFTPDELVGELQGMGFQVESDDEVRQLIKDYFSEEIWDKAQRAVIGIEKKAKAKMQQAINKPLSKRKKIADEMRFEKLSVIAEQLTKLAEVAPKLITPKQIAYIYALKEKNLLSDQQFARLKKIFTGKKSLKITTPTGKLKKELVTKEKAQEFISAMEKGFVSKKPIITGQPPAIPRTKALVPSEWSGPFNDLTDFQAAPLSGLDPVRAAELVDGKLYGVVRKYIVEPARKAERQWKLELKNTLDVLTKVSKGIGSKSEASKLIFKYIEKTLTPEEEVKITDTIRQTATYMSKVYDSLLGRINEKRALLNKVPIQKRQDYITHTWELSLLDEFYQGLSNIPDDVVNIPSFAKSNSPFFKYALQRLGGKEFELDAIAAFKSYISRAYPVIHNTDVLKSARPLVNRLPSNAYKYFTQYLDETMALRPSQVDKMVPKPLLRAISFLRKQMGKGAILGNFASAFNQLFTLPNIVSAVGPKWTASSVLKMSNDNWRAFTEANSTVLQGRIFEIDFDPTLLRRVDNTLGFLIQLGDREMVRWAFGAALEKAIHELDMPIEEAVKYADEIAFKTQSGFNVTDLPPAFRSRFAGSFLQFQNTVNNGLNYLRFDIGKEKGERGKWGVFKAGLLWLGTLLACNKIYRELGIPTPIDEWTDIFPLISMMEYGPPVTYSVPTAILGWTLAKTPQDRTKAQRALYKSTFLFLPAGNQVRKTLEGIYAASKGGKFDNRGRLLFPVTGLAESIRAVAFGPYGTKNGQAYIRRGFKSEVGVADAMKAWNE